LFAEIGFAVFDEAGRTVGLKDCLMAQSWHAGGMRFVCSGAQWQMSEP
jgi:hypothetical protein